MPPFRQPASQEEDEWTPPAYAGKPIEESSSTNSDKEWSPPSYAGKAIEEEKPKKSEFKARASRAAEDFVKDVKSIPAAASKFMDEHPKIREAGARLMSGDARGQSDLISPEDKAKGSSVQGEGFQEFPGVARATDYLQHKIDPTESPWYSGVRPFAAGLTKLAGGAIAAAADPRAMFKAEIHPAELPIREKPKDFVSKSSAKPYQLDAELPAREPVRLAPQTKDIELPRSAEVPTEIKTPGEVPKKDFVNPFKKKITEIPQERTSEEELTKGFGGSGHPESPDYTSKVLEAAGTDKEKPGLSVEDKEGFKHVVYRNKQGEPVAAAKVVTDSAGKSSVQDLAADKTKGLLTGRAMMHIGDKLQELGATESSGTISVDAQNFLDRMKGSPKKIKEAEEFADSVKTPELVKPGEGIKTNQEYIDAGHKVPETQEDGSTWIHNLYGKDMGGVAGEREIETINDTNRMKRNAGEDVPSEFPVRQPTAKFAYDWPEAGGKQYNVEGGPYHGSTVGEARLREQGIEIPESSQAAPENANELPIRQNGDQIRARMLADRQSKLAESSQAERNAAYKAELEKEEPTRYRKPISDWTPPDYVGDPVEEPSSAIALRNKTIKPEILSPDQYTHMGDVNSPTFGNIKRVTPIEADPEYRAEMRTKWGNMSEEEISRYMKLKSDMNRPFKDLTPEMHNEFLALQKKKPGTALPDQYLLKKQAEETRLKNLTGNTERKALGEPADDITEMHGGLGFVARNATKYPPAQGPNGPVLDKLFQSMLDAKEKNVDQAASYRQERARRFAAFAGVKDTGETGAAKSLSKLKGQYDKIEPGEGLKMEQGEVDQLFTAVKKANITSGEKARGYTALFKLMNGESVPQRNELAILDNVFGNGFADRITQMHGGLGAVGLKVSKLANTMKSLQNSISLAAPLRHGIGLVVRKEFAPAFGEIFKYFAKPEYYNAAMDALEKRPNYLLGREAGLFTAKPNSLMNSEEEFLNSYAGSIPGIKQMVGASQRAYTGFLNKLRSDTFDSMIKQARSLGHDISTTVGDEVIPSKETKAIARYINNATGRGDLGSLNKITNELNTLLWSPRMIASRINMLANPKIYTDLPKGMRLDGLKSLLGIAALGTAIDTLGAYGGAKVSTNILSTDFGKSRFGTKLIDPWGGFQQYVVGAARFLAGKTDSNTPTSRLEIAGRFLANKESPAAHLAHTLLTARKFTGKSDDPETAGNFIDQYGNKTSIQYEVAKSFLPIFEEDMKTLVTSEPDWSENIGLTAAMTGASLAGMSQQYAEKKSKLGFRRLR